MKRSRPQRRWQAAAGALALRLPLSRLHPRALAAGLAVRGPWAVAFSGGADSLALLLVLWAHFPERRRQLLALHFNHRLRGRAADADARFCAEVCRSLGVPLVTGRWVDPPAAPSEATAREARHAFFAQALRRRRSAALWFGHQQDDIAETLLMRLARGSGSGGLAAPRPVQPLPGHRLHLRPLLTVSKTELVAALRAESLPWREDATNAGDSYLRNRIRSDVLPAWCAANRDRDALAGAALSRERLEEDDEALEAWRRDVAPLQADGALDLRPLAGRPRGLLRRAALAWLGAHPQTGKLSRQAFDALVEVIARGQSTRFSVGRAGFAVVRRGILKFEPPRPAKPALVEIPNPKTPNHKE